MSIPGNFVLFIVSKYCTVAIMYNYDHTGNVNHQLAVKLEI